MATLQKRLTRAFLLALLLGVWGAIKVEWEEQIAQRQNDLRFGGVPVTMQLRSQLGQGLTIGLLSGMRAVVADCVWLEGVEYWEDQEWRKLCTSIAWCNVLQPRSETFWWRGGYEMAFDAACEVKRNTILEPNLYRRMRNYFFWVEQGREIFEGGVQNNPQSAKLWEALANLYDRQLHDEENAARCYQKATACPDSPIYLERFAAYCYEKEQRYDEAYLAWANLYHRLSAKQLEEPQHWRERIVERIKSYEAKLNVPKEKRIFP
jgi:tetratricopeptide (TPR) repeat protein